MKGSVMKGFVQNIEALADKELEFQARALYREKLSACRHVATSC